jgi:hypothetical protein
MTVHLRKIYHNLPYILKKVFIPLTFAVSLIYSFRIKHWLLTGEEKSSGNELVFTYAGNEWNKNYFAGLAFRGSYSEKYLGVKWLWQINGEKQNSHPYSAMLVREIPANIAFLFQNNRDFQIPNMINLETEIPENITSLLDSRSVDSSLLKNRSLKSDLTRIKRNKLAFEVTEELSHLTDFYHNMYIPYTKKSHDNKAVYTTIEWIRQQYKPWDLLFIKQGDKRSGGILLSYRENKGHLKLMGIVDGDVQLLQDGITGALYYFSLCHIREKGYKIAVLGYTRPFLKDGVLRYKKRWRPRIEGTFNRRFILRVLSIGPGVKSFLINNPFVYIEGSKLKGAVFTGNDRESEDAGSNAIYSNYYIDGLSEIYRYRIMDAGLTPELIPLKTNHI